MARLIFICPYISGNGTRRSNHVNYIATREGVEILAAKELNYTNKDTHPHVHMVIYSTDPKEGYLTKIGIRQLKSALANDIFRPEMLEYYSQKTEQRDELNLRAQNVMKELIEQMETGTMENEKIELLMCELSEALKSVSGKKQYGYLSPSTDVPG